MRICCLFFRKPETKGGKQSHHSTTQAESIPPLKHKTFHSSSNKKKAPLAPVQGPAEREQQMARPACGCAEAPGWHMPHTTVTMRGVRGHVQEQGVAAWSWGSRGGPCVLRVWVCVLLSRQSWPSAAKKAVPWQGLMAGWCSLLWLVHSFQVKLGKWHCVKIPSRMNVLLPQCI